MASVKVTSPSVSEIFSSMEYGPAPESDKVAMAWLDDHNRLGLIFFQEQSPTVLAVAITWYFKHLFVTIYLETL